MKIFLLNPPFRPNFMRNARWATVGISGSEWYPIYLAYCTGLLEREGFEVKLLDAQVDGLSHEETYRLAREFQPALLVLYFSTTSQENDLRVGEAIREQTGCEVVLVGPWSSCHPAATLKAAGGIRYLAEGEFDFTVLELARGVDPREIRGLHWKERGGEGVTPNPPRPPVSAEELDRFPFVTDVYRRHLNIRNYHQTGHRHPFIDLFTGRGCAWGRCTFCLWPFTINRGATYRRRRMESVIEELEYVRKEMPYIREVFIQDDVLPGDRARELAEAILRSGLKLTWSCYSRANLDLSTLKLMKRSGCRTLHVGYESSSPLILKNICKGVSPERMVRFTRDARQAGLFIVADFITGLPGETVETIKATTAWAIRLPVQRYTITLPKPYPGTPLYGQLEREGSLQDGRPDYPGLSYREIREWNKWSLRKVYLNPRYLLRMMIRPGEWFRLLRSAFFFFPYLLKKQHPYQ